MGLSFPLLSSMLLVIVMGMNQAASEPSMYWDKVLPNTPMPSAIKKLLPQVVAMKSVDSRNVVDGAINFGRRGVGVNNNKPIAGAKSNDPTTLSDFPLLTYKNNVNEKSTVSPINFSDFPLLGYKNEANKKSAVSENDKSIDPSTIFNTLLNYDYQSVNRKSATSENVKSNDPSTIFNTLLNYDYQSANRKSATSENSKSNDPSTIFNTLLNYDYQSAIRKSATSENDNPIAGTKSNDPATLSDFPLLAYKNNANEKSTVSPIKFSDIPLANYDANGKSVVSPINFSDFPLVAYDANGKSAVSPINFSDFPLVAYDANGKSAVSENDKSNDPSTLFNTLLNYEYHSANRKSAM